MRGSHTHTVSQEMSHLTFLQLPYEADKVETCGVRPIRCCPSMKVHSTKSTLLHLGPIGKISFSNEQFFQCTPYHQ